MQTIVRRDYLTELARNAKHGDTQALDALLCDIQIKKVIYKIANELVGPEQADRAYHEVRVRIAKFIQGWQERAAITTWVGSITRNVCKDFLLPPQRQRLIITNVLFTDTLAGSTPADQVTIIASAELLDLVRNEFLPTMSGRCRQMLQPLIFEGLDKDDIRSISDLKRSFFNQKWRECCEALLQKIQNLEGGYRQKSRQKS